MRGDRIAELRRFIEFLSGGEAEVEMLVGELLSVEPQDHDAWLSVHPAARTAQAFALVLDAAERQARSSPQRASDLANLVIRHIGTLEIPEDSVLARAAILGRASVTRGRALLASGRRAEALEAYENAAANYRKSAVLQLELADVEAELALIRGRRSSPVSAPPKQSTTIRLLMERPLDDWRQLVHREELASRDAVAELLAEVPARADRSPAEALAIADLANAIADALPESEHNDAELAKLRAQSEKNRALALRALNRYAEALAALERARAILAPHHGLAHDRTVIEFARATILDAVGRHDETIPILAECKQRFHAAGDLRSEVLCEMMEATVLWRMRKSRTARAKLLDVLTRAEALLDSATMAAIHNNLGFFAIDLGQFAEAEQRFEDALRLWKDAGRPVGVTKSEWGRARALLRKGEIDQAVERLKSVRERFLGFGLVEEAGLCGLEIVEAKLARGMSHEAEALARDIVREFTGANLNRRAIGALSYLGDAIAARHASAATVASVGEFIRVLRADPHARFRATA